MSAVNDSLDDIGSGSTQDIVAVSTRKAMIKRLSRRERHLIVAVAILALVVLAFFVAVIVLASQYEKGLNIWNKEECRSEECIQSAAMLLQGLDRSVDPCTDFYQFSCGRWPTAHPVPDAHIYNSWFVERQEVLQRTITEVLQANVTSTDPKPVVMAHRFYKSCTDTDGLEQLGLTPMLDLLANLSLPKGLPNKDTAVDFQLAKTMAAAQRFISKDILIEIGLDKDDQNPNSTKMILHLMPPTGNNPLPDLLFPEDPERPPLERLSPKQLVLLKISYMTRVMVLVDIAAHADDPEYEVNATEVSAVALRLVLVDTQLSAGSMRNKQSGPPLRTTFVGLREIMDNSSRGPLPDPDADTDLSTASPAVEDATQSRLSGVDQLFPDYSQVENLEDSATSTSSSQSKDSQDDSTKSQSSLKLDFAQYLSVLVDGLNGTADVTDPILVTNVQYFKTLAVVLSRVKPETIQALVWWKVVETVGVHTTQVMRDMRHALLSMFYRNLQPTNRNKFCVKAVKTFLHMALSYKMAVKNPLNDTTTRVREMLSDISSAFGDLVHAVPWMDGETKTSTLDKASAVKAFIGYPEWLLHSGELDKFYEGVEMADDQFLWNMLRMKGREVSRLLGALFATQDSQETHEAWTADPIEVNAFYSRSMNSISIPAGILQVPFYYLGLEALNYGAIGSILGHELTHGFDIDGKEHDKKGLRNAWWRKEVTEEYNNRAQCFVRQYNLYSVRPNLKVNGSQTLAENIADNGGVREAFLAYRSYTQRHGSEPALPGLNEFSHEQLFFLSFANVWCQNSDLQFDALQLRDMHSPARFRVIGALSNSPDFAQVWGCPAGSPMNPTNKCIIW